MRLDVNLNSVQDEDLINTFLIEAANRGALGIATITLFGKQVNVRFGPALDISTSFEGKSSLHCELFSVHT